MGNRQWGMQLKDARTLEAIIAVGGKCYVAQPGDPRKQALFDKDGAPLANPITPVRGFLNFFVADTVETVDLYIQCPGGEFEVRQGVKPSGPNEILVDTATRFQTFVIPAAIQDTAANVETQTGFVIPAKAEVLPVGLGADVQTVDATRTINVGTLSTDAGVANGFIAGLSVAVAGYKKPSNATGVATVGSLLFVQDSANAGDKAPEGDISMQGKQITYTYSAGTTTAKSLIHLPYYLAR